MVSMEVFIVACALTFATLQVANCRQIIKNEYDIIDTCTGTCADIPTLYDKFGCKKLSGCSRSSYGYKLYYVRCNLCVCECEENNVPDRDVLFETKKLSITEDKLYTTCIGSCTEKKGLVRTDYQGCQRIEDCKMEKTGWTRGFVRCDYCTCTCKNVKNAQKYTLKNVKYDMSHANMKEGVPAEITETILENASDEPQSASRTLKFTKAQTTSIETSHTLGYGLTVTVEASAGVEGLLSLTTSVSHNLNYGFTYTSGKSTTTSTEDQIEANINVPPHSSIKAVLTAHRMNVDIPYSADLVTTYEDGSTGTRHITGVYDNVATSRFRVQYQKPQPYSRR